MGLAVRLLYGLSVYLGLFLVDGVVFWDVVCIAKYIVYWGEDWIGVSMADWVVENKLNWLVGGCAVCFMDQAERWFGGWVGGWVGDWVGDMIVGWIRGGAVGRTGARAVSRTVGQFANWVLD